MANRKKILQILQEDNGKYDFIRGDVTDGKNGRCAWGLVLSRYGWDGLDHATLGFETSRARAVHDLDCSRSGYDDDIYHMVKINNESNDWIETIEKLKGNWKEK